MRTLCLISLLWLFALSTRADSAFIMVPNVETGIADDVRAHVLAALTKSLALHGFSVTALERAQRLGAACGEQTCVPAALDKLSVTYGVQASLLNSPGERDGVLGSLGLAIYDHQLAYRVKAVRVLDRGIERAVEEIVREANRMKERGPGPWLVVDGTPTDANLRLDGKELQQKALPYEQRVEPGNHVITASRAGYVSEEYHLLVGDEPSTQAEVWVQLTQATRAQTPQLVGRTDESGPAIPPESRRNALRPHAGDYLLGGLVATGGLALALVNPLRTAKNKDECRDGCRRVVKIQAGPTAGYVIGGLATIGLGAALTWWIKPVALLVDADRNSAQLSATVRF